MVEIARMPGHLVRRFQQIAVAVFHAEVEALGHDITPVQYAALVAVGGHEGIDQTTLAGMIAYDRATITGVIDRLVQKGLLVRRVGKRDRRARQLGLTPEGRQVIASITPAVEAAQKVMLRGLTPAEAAELIRLMTKAIEATNDLSRAPMRPGTEDRG